MNSSKIYVEKYFSQITAEKQKMSKKKKRRKEKRKIKGNGEPFVGGVGAVLGNKKRPW